MSNGFAAACSLNPEGADRAQRAGRDGFLRLLFEREGATTVLRRSRFSLPLQVLSPLTLEDGTAYLQMLNPTGGILGGDYLHSEITLAAGANVCLTTPSASRVYRAAGPPSIQDTSIKVATGATIEFLPDHLIPHPGSSLRQSLRVEMQSGSKGIFLDAFATGRQALHEHWNFRDLDLLTEITLCGQLVFLNRLKIDPAKDHPHWIGAMNNFAYAASLTIVDDHPQEWPQILGGVRQELDLRSDIYGAASLLPRAGLSVRLLAKSAIALSAATRQLWTAARRLVLKLPALELRKY